MSRVIEVLMKSGRKNEFLILDLGQPLIEQMSVRSLEDLKAML